MRTQYVLVNSKDRTTGDTNDFTVQLPQTYSIIQGVRIMAFSGFVPSSLAGYVVPGSGGPVTIGDITSSGTEGVLYDDGTTVYVEPAITIVPPPPSPSPKNALGGPKEVQVHCDLVVDGTIKGDSLVTNILPGVIGQVVTVGPSGVAGWANPAGGGGGGGGPVMIGDITSSGAEGVLYDNGVVVYTEDLLKLFPVSNIAQVQGRLDVVGDVTFSGDLYGRVPLENLPPGTEGQVVRSVGGGVVWSTLYPADIESSKDVGVLYDDGNDVYVEQMIQVNTATSTIELRGKVVTGGDLEVRGDVSADGDVSFGGVLTGTVPLGNIPGGVDGQVAKTVGGVSVWSDNTTTAGNILPGTNTQILRTIGSTASWVDAVILPSEFSPGINSQMLRTIGGATSWVNANILPSEVMAGTNGQYLKTVGSIPSWANLLVGTGEIAPGTNGQVLKTVGTTTAWANNTVSVTDVTPGANNQILRTIGGVATWRNPVILPSEISPGANSQMLRTIAGSPSWVNTSILPTEFVQGFNGQYLKTVGGISMWSNLSVLTSEITPGTNGQVLKTVGSSAVWVTDSTVVSTLVPGTDAQILRTIGTTPTWVNPVILPSEISPGANSQLLRTIAGSPSWVNAAILPSEFTSGVNGQYLKTVAGASTWTNLLATPAEIAPGTNGQVLKTVGTATAWAANTIAASGVTAGANGQYLRTVAGVSTWANLAVAPGEIAPGTSGQVLTTVGSATAWATPATTVARTLVFNVTAATAKTLGSISTMGVTYTSTGQTIYERNLPAGFLTGAAFNFPTSMYAKFEWALTFQFAGSASMSFTGIPLSVEYLLLNSSTLATVYTCKATGIAVYDGSNYIATVSAQQRLRLPAGINYFAGYRVRAPAASIMGSPTYDVVSTDSFVAIDLLGNFPS